jgi:hypothetical protein
MVVLALEEIKVIQIPEARKNAGLNTSGLDEGLGYIIGGSCSILPS